MGIKHLRLGFKLAGGFGLVVVIFLAFVAYQLSSLDNLGLMQHEGMERAEDAVRVEHVDSWLESGGSMLAQAFIQRDPAAARADFAAFKAQAIKDMADVAALVDTDEERAHAAEFSNRYKDYLRLYEDRLLPTMGAGVDMETVRPVFARADALRAQAMESLDVIVASLEREMAEADARFDTVHEHIAVVSKAAAGGGLLVAVIVASLITLAITRPLRRAVAYAGDIARGDFGATLDIRQGDEIGILADAMRTIPETLEKVTGEFRRVVDRVRVGHLRERGDAARFQGEFAALIAGGNDQADAMLAYIDNVASPIMAIDNEHNILYMNAAGAAAGNTTPEKLTGSKCWDHFRTGDCRTEDCACHKAMRSARQENSETDAHPAAGDLDIVYSATPIKDADGQVVGAIEIVTDLTDIRQAQRRMKTIADRADVISQRLSSASEELSAQVEQVTQGSEVQRDRIAETATAMEQMNATVIEVAQNASSASNSSDTAREQAQQGAKVVEQAVEAIGSVHASALELQENMRQLGKQAEAIGEVMNVISDIADQTNLLALNAAIEAARAGDAGRGFAVVADEVRKLAEKTVGATTEVGSSIEAIQDAARMNIASMDRAAKAVEKATELANASGHALHQIVSLVGDNAAQVEGIATASEEQSAASEQINRALDEVNLIVSETAEGMVQSSQALQELAAMSSELREIIGELAESGNGDGARSESLHAVPRAA